MFFIMGINDDRRDLEFSQMIICDHCGAYGRYSVFMTYTVLSLFFIPLLKWNRKYYVQSSCCGSVYLLNSETGARIARGESVEIRPEELTPVHQGGSICRCANCGYAVEADFDYCPKCGRLL